MKNFVIILDGPKGAGKTTLAKLLEEKMKHTEVLSLDAIRRAIPQAKATRGFNQKAFSILLEDLAKLLKQKTNVIVDMGLSEERFDTLKRLAAEHGAMVRAYSLIATNETLLERVRERDKQEGKVTNKARFQEVYAAQQSKPFNEFTMFDTSKLGPEEMVNVILAGIEGEHFMPKLR